MLLKHALDLRKNIEEYRQKMYDLVSNKGVSDPEVVKISQELDERIIKLQKIYIDSIQNQMDETIEVEKEAE